MMNTEIQKSGLLEKSKGARVESENHCQHRESMVQFPYLPNGYLFTMKTALNKLLSVEFLIKHMSEINFVYRKKVRNNYCV